ncbi:ricin-type beta-trefoil lectin domain protein [Kitasatospora sp. NBC_00240]|uniref:glycoside hydrolase family 76 protein n=1 Tax=Kitasatospora sp. NBC_00240 TaxID=2903567 RepID=UPI002252C262|nr:glycoside hydrolase family 76 protein [Kitasatospora sp. NBC_00240]MCX5214727.1 ricin-type beta-trefoil lectin domain protein [Kitasatospora sp. NBC_00240]
MRLHTTKRTAVRAPSRPPRTADGSPSEPGAQGREARRRRRPAVLGTAVTAAALGLSTVVGAAGSASAATPAANGAAALMKSYNAGTGQIGTGWWNSAVALSTIETYQQNTGDAQYSYAISGAFEKHKASNFVNEYLDDTGWWGLVWVQAYDLTGNPAYLQMARTDAEYIHGYWDSTCGGGVWWSTAKGYKNAIPNELFLQLTAALHNRVPGDTTYLNWAKQEWNWFKGTGMINSSHLVNDGLTSSCKNNGQQTWSYNQGVVLAGLAELSKATGDAGLLTTARQIADAAVSHLSKNGILTEPCEPGCNQDAVSFKGIFVRGLRQLATAARTTAYDSWLNTQASSITAHDTNSGGFGVSWAGPIRDVSSSTTASAEDALVAALPGTPANPTGPVRSGLAGKCLDDDKESTTPGAKAQIWDCNGGPAQQWTVDGQTLRAKGLCLDITGNGTAGGTPVELWTCNGAANQKWQSVGGALVNPATGKCLDDPHSSTTNGTQLQIWACNGATNQKWTLPQSN